jgi:hypothetical protein
MILAELERKIKPLSKAEKAQLTRFLKEIHMCKNRLYEVSQRNRTNFHIVICISVIVTMLLMPFKAEVLGRTNLPHMTKRIVISGTNHTTLQKFFGSLKSNTSHGLNEETERILLDMLPEDYQAGCQDMISYWGTVAEGTAKLSVQALFIRDTGKNETKQVLLAYRCFSTYEGYRDEFYDERLAVLLINPTTSSLVFMPHAEDCKNCSDLSHIRFDQVVQHDAATPLVSLLILTSNNNPCCDGPFQFSEEWIHYYIFHETGIKLVASVLRHREEDTHDDVNGDLATIYDARVIVQRDQSGNVSQIVSHYSLKKNEELQDTG